MNREILVLANEISDYLEQHPEAADSLEGIRKWWLSQNNSFQMSKDVFDALEYLCDNNVVIKTIAQAGNIIYSSAFENRDSFLKKEKQD